MEIPFVAPRPPINSVCVFCGSNPGRDPRHLSAAEDIGRGLASRGITTVYGGASVGLMGALADAALANDGRVIGVIPNALQAKEVAHLGLDDLRVVESMHERKALMAGLSDAFVALPGGIGTLEEIFEVWTWAQLGDHQKPCALLNVGGFYDGLLGFLDGLVDAGFVKPAHRDMLIVADTADALLAQLEAYVPPRASKWLTPETI
jgi:uncharacterized protein (TIGR00730 family)